MHVGRGKRSGSGASPMTKQTSVLARRGEQSFGISARDLLTINEDGLSADNLRCLREFGGVAEVADLLDTDLSKGLPKDDNTEQRTKEFGSNFMPTPDPLTWWSLFVAAFDDATVIILIVSAFVSLAVGFYGDPAKGWIEGAAILVAVLVVAVVTATNDYSKDQQFRALNEVRDNILVKVIRAGNHAEVSTRELTVGDLVLLECGDKIPCDGVLVRGSDVRVDESSLTGEAEEVRKVPSEQSDGAPIDSNGGGGGDPFLLSGCVLTAGHCSMMAIAVGAESRWGRIKAKLSDDPSDTPLQEKLDSLAGLIGYVGMGAAAATFCATMAIHLMDPERVIDSEHLGEKVDTLFEHVLHAFIIAVTIVVVAVPEGLPLAVTISLAYSTKKMLKDNNLIRVLAACETMGNATNICSDKTGTLTENRMTVVTGWFAGRKGDADGIPRLSGSVMNHIATGVAVNTTARLRTDEDGTQSVIGSKTEGALLVMLQQLDMDYLHLRQAVEPGKVFTFSSVRKRMSTLVPIEGGRKIRVYCKGAAEIVLGLCTHVLDTSGKPKPMSDTDREELDSTIQSFAGDALRAIAIAHVDIPMVDNLESLSVEEVEKNMCFDAVVGIKDPLRKDVKEAVRQCQAAGIMVRMVTGDNAATARAIAKECGILTEGGLAIEGPEFRKMSPQALDEALPKLQVLARSSPSDKYILVSRLNGNALPTSREEWEDSHPELDWEADRHAALPGYREEWAETRPDGGEVVGATGDGTNDAPALKVADVGLSMGLSGTDVAKDASDIVIMDDRFSSIVKAVLWGRSVFDNIRKFLQFQLTVNVVALTLTFLGAVSGYEPPLNAVMMLWVNLIMDTMGALALGTESPTASLLRRRPLKRNASLVDRLMWRHIFVQSIYQLVLLTWMLLAGASLFGVKDGSPQHFTIVFNVFVFCQIFNEFNARSIGNNWNIVRGLSSNPMFQGVIVFTVLSQYLIVQFGGEFTRTVPLTAEQWLFSIFMGTLTLPLGVVMRLIPPRGQNLNNFAGYTLENGSNGTVNMAGAESPEEGAEDNAGLLSALATLAVPLAIGAYYIQTYMMEDGGGGGRGATAEEAVEAIMELLSEEAA